MRDARTRSRAGDPSIAVVVTNFNYGHFLEACLDSLRAQTVAADQVIVIDDGSTDASREVLAETADAEILLQDNAGQSAAFNRGMEAVRSDVVIFLDADDQLRPQAIETIKRVWSSELALVSYDLTLIDENARAIGHYPMAIPERDRRAQLLKRLQFPFMPTSGNAFNRRRIAWAFPLPEPRWKISADTLLVRVGMLSGPALHLPQVLGRYTAHGQNNFYTEGLSRQSTIHRSLVDTADAGLDLLELSRRRDSPLTSEDERDLARGALEVRLRAETLNGDAAGLSVFRQRLARLVRPASNSLLPPGPPLLGALGGTGFLDWVQHPGSAPRLAAPLLHRRRGTSGPHTEPMVFEVAIDQPRRLELPRHLVGDAWVFGRYGDSCELVCDTGQLAVCRLGVAPSRISITLGDVARGTVLEATLAGDLIFKSGVLKSGETLDITLPAPSPICPPVEVIQLRCLAQRVPRPWKRRARRIEITSIDVAPLADMARDLVVPTEATDPPGIAKLGSGAMLRIARPALQAGALLRVTLGPHQSRGQISLEVEGERLLDGAVGPNHVLTLEVPPESSERILELAVSFQPDAPLDEPEVELGDLTWLPGPDRRTGGPPVMAPGRRYPPVNAGILVEGWAFEDPVGAVLMGACAQITFSLPAFRETDKPVLELDLERLDPPTQGADFAVVATVDDAELATVNLKGRGILEVPIPLGKSPVTLFLHAAPIPLARHAGLRLHGLQISGCTAVERPKARLSPVVQPRLSKVFAQIGSAAERDPPEQEAIRDASRAIIANLSDRGAKMIDSKELQDCAQLGAKLRPATPPPGPPTEREAGPWLRWLACAMLAGPAWRIMPGMQLTDFPAGALGYARQIGRYLADNPVLENADEANLYTAWLAARHAEAKSLLATEPREGWRFALAREFVRSSRPIGIYFQDTACRAAAEAIGGSLETLLLREGHDLLGTEIEDKETVSHATTRVAILLRHAEPAPETWILRGILARLDRTRFEPTIYLLETSLPDAPLLDGERIVALGQLPFAMAVADIRADRPDVVLLGTVALGYSPMSVVAAHRLAPRQIALSAITPLTTGLRSVDEIILGDMVTPDGAEGDYSEITVRAPGTGQPFLFLPPPKANPTDTWRAQLGIEEDAAVLVSGAMHDKIVPDLLKAWFEILAAAPASVLVLYPFAKNWLRDFDTSGFLARIEAQATQTGIARERVKVLAPIDHARVLQVLSEADLYLDSFPFSGATTVVEALLSGLPAVTHAGSSQRCYQGSGWLRAAGLEDCVAPTRKAYVDIAARLAEDRQARQSLARQAEAGIETALRQDDFVAWLGNYLAAPRATPAPRYVFHHLPKAGGTSTRRVLSRWFNIVGDYREPWATVLPKKRNLAELGTGDLLAGHFAADTMPLGDRYPELSDTRAWRKICFVREPLDLALSIYFFDKARRGKFDKDFRPKPLGQFLRDSRGFYLQHFECDADTWREALDKYWFIGTLERFEECVLYLADVLGKPPPEEMPVLNVTERAETPLAEDIRIFTKNNRVEFDMYREINARLSKTLGEPILDRL
ncbi:MAG: glycosyltransferase [Pseudomonadota bacterium]